MKVLLTICLIFGLALTANCVRVRTHAKSQSRDSWQYYVDDQMIGTGNSAGGVIIGLDGTLWAGRGLTLNAGEAAAIVKLFKNPANVFATGVTVGGIKYMGIKGDERSIYGKKGPNGVTLVKTGKAILISIYDETIQPGNAANVVEKLADYLIDSGY